MNSKQPSLRGKLVQVIMLTVGLALLMAMAAFLLVEVRGYRAAAKRELQILAEVVGEGASAALEFKDPAEGRRILASLRIHRHIVEATLFERSGQALASYRREGDGPGSTPPDLQAPGFTFEGNQLWLVHPVRYAGDNLGNIYLRADMAELNDRLAWVLAGGVVLTLLIGSAASLVAIRMGRVVSEPIMRLTEATLDLARGQTILVRPTRQSDDEVGLLVDAFNDLLDQLGERKSRLLEAQQLAHLGNWGLDADGRPTGWSEETFRIFGLDPSLPMPDAGEFLALLHPEDAPAVQSAWARSLGPEGRFELDHRIVRSDGAVAWVHTSGVRFEERADRFALRGTVMDISERKIAEAALLQGQKLESLGVLAGGIAHDFNNLLAAIQGFVDMARVGLPAGLPADRYLEKAEAVVQRAADLVRQMLAYSGNAKFQVKPLDLGRLVVEMTHLLSVSISKRAALKVEADPDLPAVIGDSAQLQQVVMNLVINASDAILGDGGVIKVGIHRERLDAQGLASIYAGQGMTPGTYIVLQVEDNGHGMDAATQARIFEPFFTTKFAGRGLGLAAMLGIVRGHHGGMKVYSEVGKGTTFKVLFPASEQRPQAQTLPEEAKAYRGSGTVLLVDDEPDLLSATASAFEHLGFDTLLASDGTEALVRIRENPGRIRLVLMDLTMPHMDGAECYRAIRALEPALPVLLMSGFSEHDDVEALRPLGLAGFLQKPFSFSTLVSAVQSALA